MTAVLKEPDADPLASWAYRRPARAARSHVGVQTLRFALYGRISTKDFQDRVSSHAWQREAAYDLISGHGSIVAEFFDAGCSRRRSWHDRPQAAVLLAALADPDRGFDAVVVGEYER